VTCANAPVPESTENTDTESSRPLAAASNPPPGLNATDTGRVPVPNGEPATGVNAGGAAHAPLATPNQHAATTSPTTNLDILTAATP
jgi:hypothetical protein